MDKEINRVFSDRFKMALAIKRVKQQEVADALKVSRQVMSAYATGKIQPPMEVLAGIARYLNVSLDYLLGLKERMEPLIEEDPFASDLELIRQSYATLPLQQRQAILQFLDAFKNQ